jgi:pseudo-rSAM protein
MEKCWLYINSYTFIWINGRIGIVYNSKNYKQFLFTLFGVVQHIVDQLLNVENMYCITLTEKEINHPQVKRFIDRLIIIQSGLLLSTTDYYRKPISFYPQVKIMKSANSTSGFNGEVMKAANKYLTNVSIFINGMCKLNCKDCNINFKQMRFCTKSRYELSLQDIKSVLDQLQNFYLKQINILGGNISEHSDFFEFVKLLSNYSFDYTLYIHYLNLEKYIFSILDSAKQNIFSLSILVDSPMNIEMVKSINSSLVKHNVNWIFAISEFKEFNEISALTKSHRLKNVQIKPIFNQENLDFFKESIFLNKEDILRSKLNKQDIFGNQVLNKFKFGRLYYLPNKEVYSDLNLPPIGSLNDPIVDLIMKELLTENSWRETRASVTPCNNCIYKYLCPPISNYEYAIGKFNLCTV